MAFLSEPSVDSKIDAVWQQTLVEELPVIKLGDESYLMHGTRKQTLRQVNFIFQCCELLGLNRTPIQTPMGTTGAFGKRVMQFLGETGLQRSAVTASPKTTQ